jgi:hypothetical protein
MVDGANNANDMSGDGGRGEDDERTVPDSGRAGRTAVFPTMPPPEPPPGPEPASASPARPADRAADRSARRLLIPAGIAAAILVVAIGASMLIGNLFGSGSDGDGGGGDQARPTQPPAGFSTVSEATGRLRVTVPTGWAKQQEETWSPASVGLAGDPQRRPVLRATPSLAQFQRLRAATPGVFVGMTTDLTPGRLPPPGFADHPGCTREQPQPYRRGTLNGTITRWVRCDGGPISFSEVGLADTGGRFGLWIRVKQIDNTDLTRQILDSLRAQAP